jgi:hypothetical protein
MCDVADPLADGRWKYNWSWYDTKSGMVALNGPASFSIPVERMLTKPENVALNNDCLTLLSYQRDAADPYSGGMLAVYIYDPSAGFQLVLNVHLKLPQVSYGDLAFDRKLSPNRRLEAS